MSTQDYAQVAATANNHPGVWFTLRKHQTSANLVTHIRQGKVKEFPPERYEAKSSRYSVKERGKNKSAYDIEVLCKVPEDEIPSTALSEVLTAENLILVFNDPEVRQAIRNATRRLDLS